MGSASVKTWAVPSCGSAAGPMLALVDPAAATAKSGDSVADCAWPSLANRSAPVGVRTSMRRMSPRLATTASSAWSAAARVDERVAGSRSAGPSVPLTRIRTREASAATTASIDCVVTSDDTRIDCPVAVTPTMNRNTPNTSANSAGERPGFAAALGFPAMTCTVPIGRPATYGPIVLSRTYRGVSHAAHGGDLGVPQVVAEPAPADHRGTEVAPDPDDRAIPRPGSCAYGSAHVDARAVAGTAADVLPGAARGKRRTPHGGGAAGLPRGVDRLRR